MVQFNLLPDVKLAYIKARRMRSLVTTVAVIATAVCLVITVLLFVAVNVVQKQHLSNLSTDIERDSKKLQDVSDLDKILTVQNQLNHLTPLHEDKFAASRMYTYISQVTPAADSGGPGFVKYESIEVNFIDKTMKLIGSADTIKTVNQFVDTLKFTTFKATTAVEEGSETTEANAFSQVVLTQFGRNQEGATFQIDLLFDEIIFDNTLTVELTVPNTITTRSVIERPGSLFQQNAEEEPEGEEE